MKGFAHADTSARQGGPHEDRIVTLEYRAVGTVERASLREARQAVRGAVRAYARDPSDQNASKVERVIAALRQQRVPSRP